MCRKLKLWLCLMRGFSNRDGIAMFVEEDHRRTFYTLAQLCLVDVRS